MSGADGKVVLRRGRGETLEAWLRRRSGLEVGQALAGDGTAVPGGALFIARASSETGTAWKRRRAAAINGQRSADGADDARAGLDGGGPEIVGGAGLPGGLRQLREAGVLNAAEVKAAVQLAADAAAAYGGAASTAYRERVDVSYQGSGLPVSDMAAADRVCAVFAALMAVPGAAEIVRGVVLEGGSRTAASKLAGRWSDKKAKQAASAAELVLGLQITARVYQKMGIGLARVA